MTFEDMLNEQTSGMEDLVVGARINAIVTAVRSKEVAFTHGGFFVGELPISEFWKKPCAGDEVQVFISELDDGHGNMIYDHKEGMKSEVLNDLVELIDDGGVVEAEVISVARAGLNVMVNGYVDGFMPKKQVSIEYMSDFEHLIGTTLQSKILLLDDIHENLILSHKALLRDEGIGELETLEYGIVYDCVITSIAKFGLFVDVGGLTGLIHITDLDWDLSSASVGGYSRGDKIKAIAKFVSEDGNGKKRFCLSVKHLDNTPWENAVMSLPIRSVQDFKIFKIESETGDIVGSVGGVCAVIPSKEIGWVASLLSDFKIGEVVTVTIEHMDNKLGFEKIIVSHKNTKENPWEEINNTFKVGDIIDTKVTKVYSGEMLFVRLVDGVDAIVYPTDVDWVDPHGEMSKLSVGDDVRVKLTQINHLKKKLTASIKDVESDPTEILIVGFKSVAEIKNISKDGSVGICITIGNNNFDAIIENKIIKRDALTNASLLGKSVGDTVSCIVTKLHPDRVLAKCYQPDRA